MWLIWGMLIVGVPLLAMALWAEWNNRQVDKYNELKKKQKNQEKIEVPA